MRIRGLVLSISVSAITLGGVLALAAPTWAAKYVFEKELQGYTFGGPRGLSVNQATGDIYVADAGASPATIEQFSPAGVFESSTPMPAGSSGLIYQLAVDNAGGAEQGDVYVTDFGNGVVYKFDRAGASNPADEGALVPDVTTPTIGAGVASVPFGVAVDSSGNVYIASIGNNTVSEFSATGVVLHENLITGTPEPVALAVDAAGNIYVAGKGTVEYSPTGVCSSAECKKINTEADSGVALDPAGDVFVSDEAASTVREYGPTAEHLPLLNPNLEAKKAFGTPFGIAVNDTSHALYVADQNGKLVKVFKSVTARPPVVTTEPATRVNGLVEALNGNVNPSGVEDPSEYYFEFGSAPCDRAAGTCGTQATEPSQGPLTGEANIPVAVRLEGLAPNTTYHYWLVAANDENSAQHGEEQTFTTGSPESPKGSSAGEEAAQETKAASSPVFPLLTSIAPVPIPKAPVRKTVTRAQHLAKALAACNRKPKKQRAACRRQARRKYGSGTKGTAKKGK